MVVVLCVCERKREISFSVLATAILSVCSKDFTPCQPLKQLSLLSSFLYSFWKWQKLEVCQEEVLKLCAHYSCSTLVFEGINNEVSQFFKE